MRKIREVLRLKFEMSLSGRQIAGALNISPATVADILRRFTSAGLTWPPAEEMNDEQLDMKLYPRAEKSPARPIPEMKYLHTELAKPGVTLTLLWEEYAQQYPENHYSYQQIARFYREWKEDINVVMRQVHREGEKLFTDFAGQTLPIVDPDTGEIKQAHLFVATMGFSNYTYAEVFESEKLPCWVAGHVNAFHFFGSVPHIVVPDNPKALVTKADRYEPDLNRTFEEMARFYGSAVIPARVSKPRDKAKVESGVLQGERWILAALRNRVFLSLHEANTAVRERLEWLNSRIMKGVDASRRELFENVDRPAMLPLPHSRYEYATWKTVKVNIDYHVAVYKNFYSVPYRLTHRTVDVRVTSGVVEILHKGTRVASHKRCYKKGEYITDDDHRPASHRAHLEWQPSRISAWAAETGPATEKLVEEIMLRKPHPEMGYRSCLGIIRLSGRFGAERMEAAAIRAMKTGAVSYKSIKSILFSGLDRIDIDGEKREPLPAHQNTRGSEYYN